MKKKHIIIISAVLLVIIAGGIMAYSLLYRKDYESDEEDFLPEGWKLETDKLKDTTLTFYINAQRQKASDEIVEAVNLKLGNDIRTKITFKYYWEYYQQFLDRIERDNASGITCDAYIYNRDFYASVKQIADEELAMDVSELFPEYAPVYYNQFTEEDLRALKVNGGIYIIPARMPAADMKFALVRQDLMEKYDIPPIDSYDDYEVYLEAVKNNEPGLLPMCYRNTSMGLFASMYGYVPLDYIAGLVYRWDDPSMKIMAWEQTPEFTECLERMRRWAQRGYLTDGGKESGVLGVVNGDFTGNYDLYVINEKAASFISDPSDEAYFNTLLRSKGITDYSYKAYPLYDGYSPRRSLMQNGVIINPLSRQPERVLMFIDWLQSEQENYDLFMYGKEDVHYIDRGDYITPSPDVVTTFLEYSWRSAFENIDRQRAYYPGQKEELRNLLELVGTRTKYAPHYGFTPDYKPVERIYEQRWMQYAIPENLAYNDIEIDETILAKMIDDLKKAGTDTLTAEIQNQLDAYVAENVR